MEIKILSLGSKWMVFGYVGHNAGQKMKKCGSHGATTQNYKKKLQLNDTNY